MLWRPAVVFCALAVAANLAGCRSTMFGQQDFARSPLFVAGNNRLAVWERAVDVLHEYNFRIARENEIDGIIETDYKVGAALTEPWHRDSVGFRNRLESTLQSIRRRVFVTVRPADGGFLIDVEAHKELEDLAGLAANSAGGATFQENAPLQRDLNLVIGQTTPSGWIFKGRDLPLENDLMKRMHAAFSR